MGHSYILPCRTLPFSPRIYRLPLVVFLRGPGRLELSSYCLGDRKRFFVLTGIRSKYAYPSGRRGPRPERCFSFSLSFSAYAWAPHHARTRVSFSNHVFSSVYSHSPFTSERIYERHLTKDTKTTTYRFPQTAWKLADLTCRNKYIRNIAQLQQEDSTKRTY